MSKLELKDQLESFESYVNDIPLVIDPCKIFPEPAPCVAGSMTASLR